MKNYRKTKTANALPAHALQLKKRITRNRKRAKRVGLLYVLAIIALAVAACLPLMTHDLAYVGVTKFYKAFTSIDTKSVEGITKLATGALYALMLLGVVINVFRALGQLKWLHKKSANVEHGFNRNVYAMTNLGKVFSGSFAVIVVTYFLIGLLCAGAEMSMILYIVLGAGALIRLATGFWGAKTGYFDVVGNEVVEHKREVGRFVPVFRNLLQLGAAFAIVFFLLKVNTAAPFVTPLLEKGGVQSLTGDMMQLVFTALLLLSVLCSFVLIKHATAITEYSIDGAEGAGMKNFRVFSFFVFLIAGGAALVKYLLLAEKALDINLLIVAGIAFVMFVIELILRKRPKLPQEKKEKKDNGEMSLDTFSRMYATDKVEEPKKKDKKAKKGEEPVSEISSVQAAPQPIPVQQPASQPAYAPVMQPQAPVQPYYQPYPVPYYQPQAQPQVQPIVVPISPVKEEAPKVVEKPVPVVDAEHSETHEIEATVIETAKADVDCPSCGRKLRVNSAVPFHRCPACHKVFQIRKTEKYPKPKF